MGESQGGPSSFLRGAAHHKRTYTLYDALLWVQDGKNSTLAVQSGRLAVKGLEALVAIWNAANGRGSDNAEQNLPRQAPCCDPAAPCSPLQPYRAIGGSL